MGPIAASLGGTLLLAGLMWLPASPAAAGNGSVAYARPISDVKIDGKLDDWGDEHERFDVSWTPQDDEREATDFEAAFRVAYDAAAGALYVALEVRDDDHFKSEGEEGWDGQDAHLLYVDKQHVPRGSGGVLFIAGSELRDLNKPLDAWDPANAETSWDDAELAIGYADQRLVYEWRLDLGGAVAANRTIGLDHLVGDRDASEDRATLAAWGAGFGKSRNTWRFGDVMLLPAGAELGRLEGEVRWNREIEHGEPSRVRITSAEHPELWVQARVEDGRYSLPLPAGDYRITMPFSLTDPFNEQHPPQRIDDSVVVQATVHSDSATQADPMVMAVYERPDFLFGEQGAFADFSAERIPEIDAFVETFRRYYEVPGVSVALVHEGKLAYHRAFGVKNVLTQEPLQDTTVFEAASITKPTFAYAVMRLVERGAFDLDAPLHEILPFPNIAADERYQKMTARHVLAHRTGLPNWAFGGPGGWSSGGELELNFEPGTGYGYSGEGFNYLSRVLVKSTGKELEELLREEVLEPMGLQNTYFALDEEQARVASIGHYHVYPSWKQRASEISVASSMHTEARDYANFAVGLIEGRGLKPETYAEMFWPHVTLGEEQRSTEEEQHIGLGFFLRDTPFGRLVEHGGNNGDFRCKFGAIPEAGLAYVIYTNNNVGRYLADDVERFLLFGRPARDGA